MSIAIIAITRNGARLGKKLQQGLIDAQLYVSARYTGQAGSKARHFDPGTLGQLVAELWPAVDGIVFIMATGIVVRMIAPHLKSKDSDPAVTVLDDSGKFAISLLSGHLGGANALAERCAFISGARPVITTATDANGLPSFDMLAKEQGWVIENISRIKLLNSLLLDDEKIAVVDDSGKTRSWFCGRGRLSYFETLADAINSKAKGLLFVSSHYFPERSLPENLLILRPRNLVLGICCKNGTSKDEMEEYVCRQLRRIFIAFKSVALVASVEACRGEVGLVSFAQQHALPAVFYSSDELSDVSVSPERVLTEAAAAAVLASSGGQLLLCEAHSANITLALAEIREPKHVDPT